MKNAGRYAYWLWLLGLLYSLEMKAQYIVNNCEQINETTVITQSLMRVSASGVFVNRARVNYRGVSSLVNEGGFSEESTNCVAQYASPCSQSAGSSGMNVLGADLPLTTISGSSPVRMYAVELARDIALQNEWQIVSAFDWQGGMVETDKSQPTHRLHWLGGSYTGAAAGRHVNGYAAWSGTGYFDLPVGDGTKMQPHC